MQQHPEASQSEKWHLPRFGFLNYFFCLFLLNRLTGAMTRSSQNYISVQFTNARKYCSSSQLWPLKKGDRMVVIWRTLEARK